MMMDRRFHPIGIGRDKKVYDLPYTVREDGDAVTVRVTQADMNALPPLETVRLDSDLTTAHAGDAGYLPRHCDCGDEFRCGQLPDQNAA